MSEPYHRYKLYPEYKANRIADRRRPKLRPVEKRAIEKPNPELTFFFMLPDDLAFAVAPGPTRITGVTVTTVGAHPTIEVKGFGRDWLFRQAADYLRSIAKSYGPRAITGILKCPPQPGATISGPLRPGYEQSYTIEIVSGDPAGPLRPGYEQSYTIEIVSGDPVVIVSKTALRPLVFSGRR